MFEITNVEDLRDFVNSIFVMSASLFIWLNVYRVFKDKNVKGVSLISMSFFTIWGFWQMYYFWNLGEIWTVLATVLLASAHIFWLGASLYYSRRLR